MNSKDLLAIIARDEDSKHQFKANVTNDMSLAAEMVAFSNTQGGMLIIGVLIVGDLWGVGKRYLNADSFERQATAKPYQKTAADEFILKDSELGYRVLTLGNPFQETQTGYFHRSVGGYFAVKMRRYQDLIERRLGGEEKALIEGLKKGSSDFSSFNAINMLNTKYIKFGDTEREVLPNPSAFGAVWFASEIKAVQTADDEMKGISESNLQNVAIVNTSKFPLDKTTFAKDSTQEIKLTDYTPNYLKYESQSSQDAFAVFSEIYYPEGWVASIDGKEVAHINVNYILRGMQVPAGKHIIEFRFDPQTYKTGATITQISAYLVGLIILIALGLNSPMLFNSTFKPSALAFAAKLFATPFALPVCEPYKMVNVAAATLDVVAGNSTLVTLSAFAAK